MNHASLLAPMSDQHDVQVKIFASHNLISSSLRESYPHFSFHDSICPTDIIKSIDDKTHVIGILDRNKNSELTLSQGEILDGLRCGLKIYGASEIGALRAKECRSMGMIGVGKIFDQLHSSFLLSEDWIYDSGYEDALSYLDFFCKIRKLSDIDDSTKKEILLAYESIPYSKRCLTSLKSIWSQSIDLTSLFPPLSTPTKVSDAKLLLDKIQVDLEQTKILNLQLWQNQLTQQNNSHCHLKWKKIDE